MKRFIVVGDIHGCWEEWQELLDLLALTADDRLFSVGDLIAKGPSSSQTLRLAREIPGFEAVIGNHEHRFLQIWQQRQKPAQGPEQKVIQEFGEHFEGFMRYISKWPYYIDLDNILIVHAGLRPEVPLEHQAPSDLTDLRLLEPGGRPWYDYYSSPKPVVFGHWVRRTPLLTDRVVGLDTGCVYGGRLSAYIWPEHRVVSVRARKPYWKRKHDIWEP